MLLISESSNPEQTGTSKDNNDEIAELPSPCDQTIQTKEVQGFIKEPLEEDTNKEQEKHLPLSSQNETEV